MKNFLFFFLVFLVFSCKPTSQPGIEELLQIDKQFSQYAEDIGYKKAFIEYAHPEAVLLRENSMPIVGQSAINEIFSGETPENIHSSWEPLNGEIALSGELGYTYGIYTIKTDSVIQKGTYVSVWKKDAKGQWKYILDSGNEGIGE